MQKIILRAHFDGEQILLDEPYELEPNARLLITVVSDQMISDEHEEWLGLSMRGLESAYAEDEAEYTENMIKRMNPNYERR